MATVLQELAKTLQAVSEEKEKIEQRNAVLEKMATMQFNPEVPANPSASACSELSAG